MNKKLAGELVLRCFHARTSAHVLHLKTRSYAEHEALDEFYSGIVDLVDSFAEAYQGRHGLIDYPELEYRQASKAAKMLNELYTWIVANKEEICDASEMQNIIDEILALLDSTNYKLQFLA